MKMLKLAVLEAAILIGSVALAQTPPAAPAPAAKPSVPQLKPEVALELTQIQNNQFRISARQQQLKDEYTTLQKQADSLQTTFLTQEASALKRSGIDDTKYTLDPGTLQVVEKPEAPKPPVTAPTTDKK
jgi:hypothetical protein